MIDFNRHIEIDQYLNGKMSSEEAKAFEAKLSADAALKQEFILQKSANLLVGNSAKLDLKNKLKEIHEQQKGQKSKNRVKTVVIALAAAIGIAAAAYVLFKSNNNAVPQKNTDTNVDREVKEVLISGEDTVSVIKEQNTYHVESEDFVEETQSEEFEPSELSKESEHEKVKPSLKNETNPAKKEQDRDEVINIDAVQESETVTLNDARTNGLRINEGSTDRDEGLIDDDPCVSVNLIDPQIQTIEPAFGGEEGAIKLVHTENNFIEFSVDGGEEFYPASDYFTVGIGDYRIVAKDENGCLSAMKEVEINYQKTNYVIQGTRSRFMEIQNINFEKPIRFEVRNGRNGKIVYSRLVENVRSFLFEGINEQNQNLPLGTYVYSFVTLKGEVVTSGEITVIQ